MASTIKLGVGSRADFFSFPPRDNEMFQQYLLFFILRGLLWNSDACCFPPKIHQQISMNRVHTLNVKEVDDCEAAI